MCLMRIEERYKIKDNKHGYGYKVMSYYGLSFRKEYKKIFSQYQGNKTSMEYNRWLREKNYRSRFCPDNYIRMSFGSTKKKYQYPYGFHILLTTKKKLLEEMEREWGEKYFRDNYKIVRVKYRYAHTKGMDQSSYRYFPTIVAKEMFMVLGKKGG